MDLSIVTRQGATIKKQEPAGTGIVCQTGATGSLLPVSARADKPPMARKLYQYQPAIPGGAQLLLAVALGMLCSIPACSHDEAEVAIDNPFSETLTFAVAPVLNYSGEFELDPIKVADLLASELSCVQGVSVLPVNRVVAFLATQSKDQIESPAHALAVAEAVGADAILVAGITEYDAYTPTVGLALQMYTVPRPSLPAFDPVLASRVAQPLTFAEMADALTPVGQVQIVYNGAHAHVVDAVRNYAKDRTECQNPFGWRQYLKVQTLFLRFCWYDAVDRLMAQQRRDRRMLASGPVMEVSE